MSAHVMYVGNKVFFVFYLRDLRVNPIPPISLIGISHQRIMINQCGIALPSQAFQNTNVQASLCLRVWTSLF